MSELEENKVEKEIEVTEIAEADASSNQASIASKPTGVSRSELLSKMVAYASKMDKDTLAQAVETITKSNDEIYNSTQHAAGDAGKNKASIKSSGAGSEPMAKVSMKEDLELVFGSEELSEDFRTRVETLFEAAVATRVELESAKIEESFVSKLSEELEAAKSEMAENVDTYLNYAVAEWIAENKLAIESNIRAEITESFIDSMKEVFAQHYISIPEEKVDVVEGLAAEVEELKAKLEEQSKANIELSKKLDEAAVDSIKEELSEGMTDTQKEKFAKLMEAVNYSTAEEFRKKVGILKETYFNVKSEVVVTEDKLLSESVEEPAAAPKLNPEMQMYYASIAKTIKK